MSRRHARATQADISRAIKAAAKAGPHMAVDILPDGTIRISPGAAQTSESPDGPRKKDIVL